MTAPEIPYSASLDVLWQDLVYTEARLLADPHARNRAAAITALIARVEHTMQSQRAAWRAEIVAQAHVDAADDALDATVSAFEHKLRDSVDDDRTAPAYKRYFAEAPNEILRMGLASELDRVRPWPATIRTEPVHALRPFGDQLQGDVDRGTEALRGRESAAGDTATHRVRSIVALVDDANAARRSLHGVLSTRAVEQKLGKHWADGFFRHAIRHAPAAHAPAATPTSPATPAATP